ncbi:MAG: hypothetical protein CFH34_00896 [Alphaproteobacteria bacterium MarineAlpha9_Bin4]|nr:hypothetical protein [Pelagibacterales bacterium]PPR26550.1 MAG: hypothetical protein CFH34_00896 [Alphaproteobacteria bacterium MarineAlpha9_Bin4]|tara:strand:+ start:1352 stop:1837 length:486 start_codon:yes stop_codon:yes gene_type:complete
MKNFLENNFKNNYDLIWKNFLQLEINRSYEAIKLLGNANAYLVLQVVAWHNFLLVTEGGNEHKREQIVKKWLKENRIKKNKKYILTYTLISELTGLPLETVRRNVKKLIKKKWVRYKKQTGVEFYASEENNKKLTNEFNLKETAMVVDFLKFVSSLDNRTS